MDKVDLVNKLKKAQEDIRKINDVTHTNYSIQQRGDQLYNKLILNQDYCKYIAALKMARRMCGNLSFNQLADDNKKDVLFMIKDAIEMYLVELEKSIKDC